MADHYAVLGVNPDADTETIRSAYRERARRLHPDTNTADPDATKKMSEINEAWAVLGDAGKRAAYDRRRGGEYGGGLGFDIGDVFGDLLNSAMFARQVGVSARTLIEGASLRIGGVNVVVKPGTPEGTQIVAGGHTFVLVAQLPRGFMSEGRVVRALISCGVYDVLLGAEFDVEGIDGQPVAVRAAPGQTEVHIPRAGLPTRSGVRGDLVLTLVPQISAVEMTDPERKVLTRLAERQRGDTTKPGRDRKGKAD